MVHVMQSRKEDNFYFGDCRKAGDKGSQSEL